MFPLTKSLSMKLNIKSAEIQEILSGRPLNTYPKYSTQILVLANQNAQSTRPNMVGQMSDLIQEFKGASLREWETWYLEKYPDAIDNATDKLLPMVRALEASAKAIDREVVRKWVEEFLIDKTFAGLKFQEAILKKIAESKNESYRLARPEEESKGIDGFIGDRAVSIKATTYKTMMSLTEVIDADMIYYEKKKTGITIEFNF